MSSKSDLNRSDSSEVNIPWNIFPKLSQSSNFLTALSAARRPQIPPACLSQRALPSLRQGRESVRCETEELWMTENLKDGCKAKRGVHVRMDAVEMPWIETSVV